MNNFFNSFWFRFIIVLGISLFINELGSVESLFQRFHTIDFYREYAATFMISLGIVEWVHRSNVILNKKVPWHTELAIR